MSELIHIRYLSGILSDQNVFQELLGAKPGTPVEKTTFWLSPIETCAAEDANGVLFQAFCDSEVRSSPKATHFDGAEVKAIYLGIFKVIRHVRNH